jgi:hypothetical protein
MGGCSEGPHEGVRMIAVPQAVDLIEARLG